jgi:hypothetical protein
MSAASRPSTVPAQGERADAPASERILEWSRRFLAGAWGWVGCAAILAAVSCTMLGSGPLPAVAPEASAALESARLALREAEWAPDPGPARERARQELLRAAALAPDWVAPRRIFDELEREELRGPQRYADYLARLDDGARSAELLYLVGRWEGVSGLRRFEAARALEPGLAWVHHALSVDQQLRGNLARAAEWAQAAFELARDDYERSFFGRRRILLLDGLERGAQADALLENLLAAAPSGSVDRLELRVEKLRRAAGEFSRVPAERSFQDLLVLLREERLTPTELVLLVGAPRFSSGRSPMAQEHLLREALLSGPNRPWLEGLERELFGRGLALLLGSSREDPPSATARERRVAAFRAGRPREAVLTWHAELPRLASWGAGERPLAAPLVALLERASASAEEPAGMERSLPWIEACLDAGWVAEGQALIEWLLESSGADLGDADVVEVLWPHQRRASAARALLGEIDRLVGSLAGEADSWAAAPLAPAEEPDEPPDPLPKPASLDDVLDRLARLVELYGPGLGWDATADAEAIRESPLLSFSAVGRLTVPGERFHERDELLGAGSAGEPVPGVSEVLSRLGRMGLFGDAVGRPPDGTVLQRLWSGPSAGEHLGVPWSGTVIVCEGADADGARSRGLGEVAGAALHEGYWLDIEPERRRLERWRSLEDEVFAELGAAHVRRLCESNVVRIPAQLRGERGERARLLPVLGAGDRLRLAVIAERAAAGSSVELAELVEVTAIHEEGHLLDRTRFLPLGRNLGLAWGLMARAGLDALGFERRLEFRAQAVALACCPDPRLPLIQLLDSAEVDARRPTVHAAAYTQLLAEFLRALDRRIESGANDSAKGDFAPAVDREAYLVHQLHRLTPEEIRTVALSVAESFGLDRR